MTRFSYFTDMWFYLTPQREREVVKQKGGKRQRRKTERSMVKEQEKYHCTESGMQEFVCQSACVCM